MRRYETTYILRPNLGEDQFTEIIERTNDIIKNDAGTIINLDRWGVKNLAYEIKKENQGYYIYCDYAAPGFTVREIERIFRIDDRVLRFLTVKLADAIDNDTITMEIEQIKAAAEEAKIAAETEEAEVQKSNELDETDQKDVKENAAE